MAVADLQEKVEKIGMEFYVEEEKVINTSAGRLIMQRGYIPITRLSTPTDIVDTVYIKIVRLKLSGGGGFEYVMIEGMEKSGDHLSLYDFLEMIGLKELEKYEVYRFVGHWGE